MDGAAVAGKGRATKAGRRVLEDTKMLQSMELAGSGALCYSKPLIHPPASFAGQSAGILLGPISLQVRGDHQHGATKRASGDLARTVQPRLAPAALANEAGPKIPATILECSK